MNMNGDYLTQGQLNLKFIEDSHEQSFFQSSDRFWPQPDWLGQNLGICHFMAEESFQQQWKELPVQEIQLNQPLLHQGEQIQINSQQAPLLISNHCLTDLLPPPSPSFPKQDDNSQSKGRRGPKKGLKERKPKNQYDKNIFPLITRVILNKMLTEPYLQEITSYCKMHEVEVGDYLSFFRRFDFTVGWGVNKFMSFVENRHISLGVRKVFKYFFVRYLKEDYPVYVMNEGRMREQQKYLRKGIEMLYIPLLTRSEMTRLFWKRQMI